jgi:hypothetical protein
MLPPVLPSISLSCLDGQRKVLPFLRESGRCLPFSFPSHVVSLEKPGSHLSRIAVQDGLGTETLGVPSVPVYGQASVQGGLVHFQQIRLLAMVAALPPDGFD